VTVLLSGTTHINTTLCATYPTAPWHPPACPPDMQQNIEDFNAAMPALAAEFTAKGSSIKVHDPNPGCDWTAADYYTWGIHFSVAGYKKMAGAWFSALKPLLLQQ
jgi:lysophospholipase L1-like esterase